MRGENPAGATDFPQFPDMDAEAELAWMRDEVQRVEAETDAALDGLAEAEDAVLAPVLARAEELGLMPDRATLSGLWARGEAVADLMTREMGPGGVPLPDDPEGDDGLGTLRQGQTALPPPPDPAKMIVQRRPSYDTEAEDQRNGATDRSFADAGSGRMRVRAEQSFSGAWDWARAEIGATFIMPERASGLGVVFRLGDVAVSTSGGGSFSTYAVEVSRNIFFFNHTQRRRWVSQKVLLATSGGNGVLPPSLPPRTFNWPYLTGYGEADRGDVVTASMSLIARCRASIGWAHREVSGTLESIALYHR